MKQLRANRRKAGQPLSAFKKRIAWHARGRGLFFLLAIMATQSESLSQAVKVAPRPRPNAAAAGSLTVSATPAFVTFNLTAKGVATGSVPINIITTWNGLLLLETINIYASFMNSGAALQGTLGGTPIPTSSVLGQMTTGLPTSFTTFTQSNTLGSAGASLQLLSQTIVLGLGSGTRTDALNLQINLTSLPTLPADTYTGTLILQAQIP